MLTILSFLVSGNDYINKFVTILFGLFHMERYRCLLEEKMAASEEVLLMMNNVKHRKVEGTMYMMDRRMAWQQRGKESFTLSHM